MTPRLVAMLGLKCLALYLLLFYLPPEVISLWALSFTSTAGQSTDIFGSLLLTILLALKLLLVLSACLMMWLKAESVSGHLIGGEAPTQNSPYFRYYLRAAYLFAGLILLLQAMASWSFFIPATFAIPSLFVFYIVAAGLLIFDAKVLLAAAKRVVTTNWWTVLMRLRARQQQRQD